MRLKSTFRVLAAPFKLIPGRVDRHGIAADSSTSTTATQIINGWQLEEWSQLNPMSVPSAPLDVNSSQFVITHIQVDDIAVDLGRIPVGFYVVVEADRKRRRTRNKPILVHEHNMEWEDNMSFPLELSSNVCIKVCASFEFSPMLGSSQVLRMFVVDVGALLREREIVKFELSPPEGDPVLPCSMLRITVERYSRTSDVPMSALSQQEHTGTIEDSSSLAQITDEGHESLSRYHKNEDPEDLKYSIMCFERAVQACPLTHQCRAIVLFNLATARLISCQVGITSPDFDIPITLYRDALDLRPIGHPDRPATLLHLARATMSCFLKWGDESYAEEAKRLIAEVQGVCSVDSYEYQLADTILRECAPDEATDGCTVTSGPSNSSTTISELEDDPLRTSDSRPVYHPNSVPELEDAILRTPNNYAQKPAMLNALALALIARSERLGDMVDIDRSIVAMERVVELTEENHPEWPQRVINLGALIGRRFHRSDDIEDLERSISVSNMVTERIPNGHPCRPYGLLNLAIYFLARSGRLARIADVDKAISLLEEALELTPTEHPNRSAFLVYLGVAFLNRFQHIHNPADLEKSIFFMQAAARRTLSALPLAYPMRMPDGTTGPHPALLGRTGASEVSLDLRVIGHWRLVNLGHAFQLRFDNYGDPTDLGRSISVREEALTFVPRDHPDRPWQLASLGSTFLMRYQRLGNLADLHNSTSIFAEAVRLTPSDHPQRSQRLAEFGMSLVKRFERFGRIVDVDKSISVGEEAVQRTHDNDPNKPRWLTHLGSSFLKRFERLGNLADLDKSASIMEEAVRLTPVGDPDRPRRLTHFGQAFGARFSRLGCLPDLNRSISAMEEAAQLIPSGDPAKSGALVGLVNILLTRSERLENLADHDRSVFVAQKAVDEAPDSPETLTAAGISHLRRFLRRGDTTDLDKAAAFMESAVRVVPEGHPNRPLMLTNLGILFSRRFNYTRTLPALRSAISCFSCAARCRTSGQPFMQFEASKLWIQCAGVLYDSLDAEAHQTLFGAYECVISLFPQLAWIGLPFRDRYAQLVEAAGITRSAVSVSVILGRMARAVEWLEQGRCVVWGQLFQLRTPLDELRNAHPDLADQIEQSSNALEQSSAAFDDSWSHFGEGEGPRESLEQRARRHRELASERENLLEQAQALPGFERSSLPKTFSQLRASAYLGPIVLLSVNPKQGDALIVVADLDEPIRVPLLGINERQAEHLRTSLNGLLLNEGRVISRDDLMRAARPVVQDGRNFSQILSDLWNKIVKPVLHALALSTPGRPTRVFWCPTGPLSFLPIHAAGNYDIPGPGNKASDFIISSYIPTLSVLAPSREETTVSNNIRLLAVSQPSTDGQAHLSGAQEEIRYIKATIGRSPSTHVHLHESSGNVEGVLHDMACSDWVHFACHGVQDASNPTDSGLCLADQRRLRLSDIIRLSRPRRGLAFLSACQTATGAVEFSEEAVHLSAGMLFSGYSSVIGTMWSIRDSVAPRLAQDVYEQLFRDDRVPDSREAARALHDAVERLIQSGEPFVSWVPFIHMGI